MSLVKDILKGLAEKGKVEHEFTLNGIKFVMEPLTTEEQILTDGLVSTESLKEKYGTGKEFGTYNDTIIKLRTVSQLTFAIKSVNGKPPVDESQSLTEQFKQRIEFRDELNELGPHVIDELGKEYRAMLKKNRELFENLEENVEKS